MVPSEIDPLLLPNEKVLWSGTPDPAIRFASQDWFLIPFGLVWGGFAIFWEVSVLTTPTPLFFRLWSIPFVIIGLYLIGGRFFIDAWARKHILYAITNMRVLIVRKRPLAKVTALSLRELGVVNLVEETNGTGTIRFDGSQFTYGRRGLSGYWSPTFDPMPQLIGIDQVRSVFALVQQTRQASESR